MERIAKPEWGNIGTGPYGKIKLSDVKDKFKEYNFIIQSNSFTVDTTKFYGCGYSDQPLSGINIQPTGIQTMLNTVHTGLVMYNLKPGKQEGNEEDITEMIIIPEVDHSNIPLNYEITIKSKRNFLENQKISQFNK